MGREKGLSAKQRKLEEQESLAQHGWLSPYFYKWFKQNVLRRSFRRFPSYYKAFDTGPSEMRRLPDKRGTMRLSRVWQCQGCGEWFRRADIVADHIAPVGQATEGILGLGQLVTQMYSALSNIQLLCAYKLDDKRYPFVSCHYVKTQQERGRHVTKDTPNVKVGKSKATRSNKGKARKGRA